MATFTAKNFPATENNQRFSGAGERTNYIATQPDDGFLVEQDTTVLLGSPCRLKEGQRVWFISEELRDAADVGDSRPGVFAAISLIGPSGPMAGYVRISCIRKPSGRSQSRVAAGAAAQKSVQEHVSFIANDRRIQTSFVSSAPPGSTAPDLIISTDRGGNIQFEIKGANSAQGTITLFDKSVRRGDPSYLDRFVGPLGFDSLEACVDFTALEDPTIGFAGDPGVGKSGKMPPSLDVADPDLLMDYRFALMEHFADSGDNYFAVYNRSENKTDAFFTGHGENVLGLRELPPLKQFKLATYGGPSNGATRVGVKVRFDYL